MMLALSALGRIESTPIPTPQVDPDLVTPGIWGFVAVVFIAGAVVLLVSDMLRRIRRGRVRIDLQAELDAEASAAAEAETSGDAGGDGADGDESAEGRTSGK